MIILFVFFKHPANFTGRKTHIYKKICRDIPRTILPVFLIRAKFSLNISDVVYTGKNHGLKCRYLTSVQKSGPKLRQKIKKHLIIGCRVHFIHQKNQWFFCTHTPLCKTVKYLRHLRWT